MLLKWKIYLGIAIVIIGIFAYQAFAIHNLKKELKESTITISTLKQNENALRDSINFQADSLAMLHIFVESKEEINKKLTDMYNKLKKNSDKEIKDLKNQVGLLYIEIESKQRTIDSLKQIVKPNFTDSTVTVPILYDSEDMGLHLDGYTFGNFKDKTGFVFWNNISVRTPKLKIGLVYDKADSTILAMVEANNKIETFKTAMSDELYRLIVDNVVPAPSWMDYVSFYGELSYADMYYVNLGVSVYYHNFYAGAGRSFAIQYDFNGAYYSVGYSITLSEIIGKIK